MMSFNKGQMKLVATLALSSTLWMGCAQSKNPNFASVDTGIINGEPVLADDPIAASTVDLYYIFPNSTKAMNICTGTVVGNKTVLSAAHCFVDASSQIGITIAELVKRVRIGFGINIIKNVGDAGVELVAVESVTINPDYKMNDLENANKGVALYDMSVIHLVSPIPTTAKIVPLLDRTDVLVQGTELVLAGFGLTKGGNFGTPAKSLNKTTVNIDNPAINPTQFSYSVVDSHSACSGDSGGPALYTDVVTGTVYVAGVTSWGDGNCKRLGVYTSVPSMLAWIQSAM